MIQALESLSQKFGEPVRGTHEVRFEDGGAIENYHIYVAGEKLYSDAPTLSEAVRKILERVSLVAAIVMAAADEWGIMLP